MARKSLSSEVHPRTIKFTIYGNPVLDLHELVVSMFTELTDIKHMQSAGKDL